MRTHLSFSLSSFSLSSLTVLMMAGGSSLGLVGCGGGDDSLCQAANHCLRVDGEVRCEDGYQWEDSSDASNYNCVAAGEDPCVAQGLYGDGICDRTCANPDPDCGDNPGDGDAAGDGDGDGGGDGDGDVGDGDGDGDVILPPDPTHPEGPRILELSSNVTALTEWESIVVSAIVTDPNGIDDLIGGSLLDATTGATYGSFATSASEGAYSITVSWSELNQLRTIDFVTQTVRVLRARFFDVAGHAMSMDLELTLSCESGRQACDGTCGESRCGGSCVSDLFNSTDDCGTCGNACAVGGQCSDGQCTCPEWAPTLCGGECVDTFEEADHCGACGNVCGSGDCGNGFCGCSGGASQCGGGFECVGDSGLFGYGDSCYEIDPPTLTMGGGGQQGLVMVSANGLQVPACEYTSSNVDQVMCRQLFGANAVPDPANTRPSSFDSMDTDGWANISCTGTETNVSQCTISFINSCTNSEPQWVGCMSGTDPDPDPEPDPTGTWTCPESYYGVSDGCDCGCGIVDPDCGNTNLASCAYPGNCGSLDLVDPSDTTQCL